VIKVDDYRAVASPGTIDIVLKLAERVQGRRFLHLSGGRFGTGAAEILGTLVPLLSDVGLDAQWEVTGGDPAFYATAAALQAALAGDERAFSDESLEHYVEMNRINGKKLRLDADLVLVHDVQPASLVSGRGADGRWVWRCHFDCSRAQRRAWSFVRHFVEQYDAVIVSLPKFARRMAVSQYVVYPSIDPLSEKNRDLSPREVAAILTGLRVPTDRPILLQVGSFTGGHDPLGVVNAYRLVKKYYNVRLVLAGTAGDDREASAVLADLRQVAHDDRDVILLELPPEAHLQINALQRAATIVLGKSVREGFGLAAAEAMWKGKPVIAGAAGGLTQLVIHEVTGYIVHSVEGAAFRIRPLLNNPEMIARLGAAGREHVRRSFLVTRHLTDYLALFIHLTGGASALTRGVPALPR
jgi:trehalose synthase